MIKNFRHKGIERFFKTGTTAGIQAAHAQKLSRQLKMLDIATAPQDMNVPGWNLHPLKGADKGHWSIWINGNWRLTFAFDGIDVILVDYRDYH